MSNEQKNNQKEESVKVIVTDIQIPFMTIFKLTFYLWFSAFSLTLIGLAVIRAIGI